MMGHAEVRAQILREGAGDESAGIDVGSDAGGRRRAPLSTWDGRGAIARACRGAEPRRGHFSAARAVRLPVSRFTAPPASHCQKADELDLAIGRVSL
jgi:hypothetical protein